MKIINLLLKILVVYIIINVIQSIQLKTKTSTNMKIIGSINPENIDLKDEDDIDLDSFMNDEENDLVQDNSNQNELIETPSTDYTSNENNTNILNFVEKKSQVQEHPKIKSKFINPIKNEITQTHYAYNEHEHEHDHDSNQGKELEKEVRKSHATVVANKLLRRKINTSIGERIEGSFRKYVQRTGDHGDKFTAFLGYLKDASNRANVKRKHLQDILKDGYHASKIDKK